MRTLVCTATALLLLRIAATAQVDSKLDGRVTNEPNAATMVWSISEVRAEMAKNPTANVPCDLDALKQAARMLAAEHDSPDFAFASYVRHLDATDEFSGYRFAISCGVASGKEGAARFVLTAVPIELGGSGVRAFCADEKGVYVDASGSAAACLANKQLLK